MTSTSLPQSLFGYEVVDKLGEGALSTVYVVTEPQTGQLYALKHVIPTEEKHLRFIEQLENEFNLAKTFRHPGLRKSHDYKVKKKLFGGVTEAALVMELIDGMPLDESCPTTLAEIVDTFIKAGTALGALHHYQFVHCDTKPGNIMREPNGGVRVIDFGQTCRVGTVKQRVQGTPDYIAPEQARCKAVNFYTDIYNFAATLYWALTRQRVPTLLTVDRHERDIVREQKYPRPDELAKHVPEDLSDLVMDCLRLSPAYRPQTMDEVLKRMLPHASKEPTTT